jgi:hypothetical protein
LFFYRILRHLLHSDLPMRNLVNLAFLRGNF